MAGSIPARAGEPGSRTSLGRRPCWGLSPRVRGNLAANVQPATWRGLSPRVRGNQSPGDAAPLVPAGLSPRVRGNPRRTCQPPAQGVYPRACGGTGTSGRWLSRSAWQGLSPRVRGNLGGVDRRQRHRDGVYPRACGGTLLGARCVLLRGRVYPRACGGTRWSPSVAAQQARVYPRACGGTSLVLADVSNFYIRSIPARAGEPGLPPAELSNGSIPARAGEPMRWPPTIPARAGEPEPATESAPRVYPRACGGTGTLFHGGRSAQCGVYPRACGGTSSMVGDARAEGSIPARAGEPHSVPCILTSASVDGSIPARAGEPAVTPRARRRSEGLSPRVRGNRHAAIRSPDPFPVYPRACGGTLPTVAAGSLRDGSIPARAGEPALSPAVALRGLSPRVRGNRHPSELACPGNGGLSPRVRGNRPAWANRTKPRRSIPARAGEPSRTSARGTLNQGGVYPRACGGT